MGNGKYMFLCLYSFSKSLYILHTFHDILLVDRHALNRQWLFITKLIFWWGQLTASAFIAYFITTWYFMFLSFEFTSTASVYFWEFKWNLFGSIWSIFRFIWSIFRRNWNSIIAINIQYILTRNSKCVHRPHANFMWTTVLDSPLIAFWSLGRLFYHSRRDSQCMCIRDSIIVYLHLLFGWFILMFKPVKLIKLIYIDWICLFDAWWIVRFSFFGSYWTLLCPWVSWSFRNFVRKVMRQSGYSWSAFFFDVLINPFNWVCHSFSPFNFDIGNLTTSFSNLFLMSCWLIIFNKVKKITWTCRFFKFLGWFKRQIWYYWSLMSLHKIISILHYPFIKLIQKNLSIIDLFMSW